MTVREFIERHPNATMDMMTPGGYVTITPEIATGLPRGEDAASHPGTNEHWAKVTAEELLSQEITQCREHPEIPNYFYMLVEYVQEHQQAQSATEMVTLSEQSM